MAHSIRLYDSITYIHYDCSFFHLLYPSLSPLRASIESLATVSWAPGDYVAGTGRKDDSSYWLYNLELNIYEPHFNHL